MLNYWRTNGGAGGGAATSIAGNSTSSLIPAASTFSDYGCDVGPFFDLDFTHINDDEASETTSNSGENLSETDEEMREIELNLDNIGDQDFKISPFYKLPIPPPSNDAAKFSHSSLPPLLELKINPISLNGEKFKGGEVKGPLISLFARDITMSEASNSSRETLQKYLNILKPLYVRVEKMKLAGGGGGGGAVSPPPKAGVRSKNLQAGFKVVRKHLSKSRSTSAAAAVSPPGNMGSNRRDDTLLEVQDGIQGAILHCKRSFNSKREGESGILSRSVSEVIHNS